MKKQTKKKYDYNYPEQRELSVGLIYGDIAYIAKHTKYTPSAISAMCRGKRKMIDSVSVLVEKMVKANEERAAMFA